jgi:hypothetical protein
MILETYSVISLRDDRYNIWSNGVLSSEVKDQK